MVRFVNDFLFIFSFVIVGCTLDTGLLSADEMQQLVSGQLYMALRRRTKCRSKFAWN